MKDPDPARRAPTVPPAAPAAAPAEDLFEAIHAVMHLLRIRQYRDGPAGMTHVEGKVLNFFVHNPGATQKDLVEHSGRDKGQLARLIGGLRDRGLLEAKADETDRRNLRLHPTAAGRAAQRALERHGQRLARHAVTNMSDDEQGQLLALLRRLRENLDSLP